MARNNFEEHLDLDELADQLVERYTVENVLAALCRNCHQRGYRTLFSKLNRVYEWALGAQRRRWEAGDKRRRAA